MITEKKLVKESIYKEHMLRFDLSEDSNNYYRSVSVLNRVREFIKDEYDLPDEFTIYLSVFSSSYDNKSLFINRLKITLGDLWYTDIRFLLNDIINVNVVYNSLDIELTINGESGCE